MAMSDLTVTVTARRDVSWRMPLRVVRQYRALRGTTPWVYRVIAAVMLGALSLEVGR